MEDDAHLPHAGVSTIFGLLEILDDVGGKEDLYKLAESLSYELDDILPVLEAAEKLGFVTVTEGDVAMTALGKTAVEEDVDGRKGIFRDRVRMLTTFKEITNTLEMQKDKHMTRMFFQEMFEMHFSPEEAERQMQTVIDWGRYAEIIGYNPDTDELYLPED